MPRLHRHTLVLVACSLFAVACGGGGDSGPTPPPTPLPDALRSVSLSPATDSLTVGSTRTLTPAPDRAGGSVTVTYTYTSSAPAVATVSGTGEVTAVAPGNATISVSAAGSGAGFTTSTRSATASIVVVPRPLALSALTVSPDSAELAPGATVTIVPTAVSASGASVVYTYESTAPTVASVSSAGVVTALTGGTASIAVTATGSGTGLESTTRRDTVHVRVVPPPAITTFTVTSDSVDVIAFRDVNVNVALSQPANAPAASLAVATSASGVASAAIANGAVRITGVTPGLATITVTATAPATPTFAAASVQRTIRVRVLPAPDALRSVVLSPAVDTLVTGATRTLTVTLDAADPTVIVTRDYRSTALAIATVNSSGVVTAVSAGTAQIIIEATGSAAGFTTRTVSDTMQLVVQAAPVLGIGFGDEQFAGVQGGEFTMGNANGQPDEVPVRVVRTNPIRMQRTEVTQAQWREIMQGTALANPDADAACGPTCPVESVSWLEVQEFLTRLNARFPGKGYRLPTEAEWEQWAKAGTTGDYGGNGVLNDMGWWSGNSGGRKHPVAQKLPNAWGLYDMHGNVWEWISDWYGPYAPGAVQNPTGPATGTQRVRRGGAFDSTTNSPRSSNRGSGNSRDFNRGFRLVLPVPLQ